jgi:uncharacterized membrane protein (DUF2068 family)
MAYANQFVQKRTNFGLLAIGIFKLVKSVILLGLGIGLLHGRNQDLGRVAAVWIKELSIHRPLFDRLLSTLSSLQPRTVDSIAAGAFVYSALFWIEGVGLCKGKRWAEVLTVVITSSLLPFEFYELNRHLTATRLIVTVANLAILGYLFVQLMHDRRHRGPSNGQT